MVLTGSAGQQGRPHDFPSVPLPVQEARTFLQCCVTSGSGFPSLGLSLPPVSEDIAFSPGPVLFPPPIAPPGSSPRSGLSTSHISRGQQVTQTSQAGEGRSRLLLACGVLDTLAKLSI